MKHPFRKKWGQNFLRDPNIIRKIIICLKPDKNDVILEIGPGDGALTDKLHSKVRHIHGVEIDPLLVTKLQENFTELHENIATLHENAKHFI